jgi:predicted nucleotidyltransferase
METYLAYWRDQLVEQQTRQRQLRQQVRSEITQIVSLLIDQFGAARIILFGSFVKGTFTSESDIDLAVEGIAPARYFAALAAVNHLTGRWVDLKPLEAMSSHFRQRVLTTGEIMYESHFGECPA